VEAFGERARRQTWGLEPMCIWVLLLISHEKLSSLDFERGALAGFCVLTRVCLGNKSR
jgi:hypothetical protein